jgi:hypothetical protein
MSKHHESRLGEGPALTWNEKRAAGPFTRPRFALAAGRGRLWAQTKTGKENGPLPVIAR